MRAMRINQIQHSNVIALFLQQMACVPQYLPFGIKHDIGGSGLHNVGLGIKTCFPRTRSSDYQHVQITTMLSPIQADPYVLS
ncbi:hypothetical protein D3C78_1567550 [compost metagenome]